MGKAELRAAKAAKKAAKLPGTSNALPDGVAAREG